MTPNAENMKRMYSYNIESRGKEEIMNGNSPNIEMAKQYYSPIMSTSTMVDSAMSQASNAPPRMLNTNYAKLVGSAPSMPSMNPNQAMNLNGFSMFGQNSQMAQMEAEKANSANAQKKVKKAFVERPGDWACIKCKNLNFSFRAVCNRCQLTKIESDKLFDQYMKNLMSYVKINELYQNQVKSVPSNFVQQEIQGTQGLNMNQQQTQQMPLQGQNNGYSNNVRQINLNLQNYAQKFYDHLNNLNSEQQEEKDNFGENDFGN